MSKNMDVEKIIGKKVFIKLTDETKKDFPDWNLNATQILATISGIDTTLGIWIVNPDFELKFLKDKDGKPIPKDQQKFEKVEAQVLISWNYIKGILDVNDARLKIMKTNEIGFKNYQQNT